MKPHKKCIERSKKHCWCIADYLEETDNLREQLSQEIMKNVELKKEIDKLKGETKIVMSKCRKCNKEVDKYSTMFGYCLKCINEFKNKDKKWRKINVKNN